MKRQREFSLHQSNFTSDGQHLEVPRVTSGGSRRRECPLPKKLPPFGHGPRDFWAKPKSCGYVSGAPPSIPPCGFAVLVIPGKKAGFAPTGAVCRSCITMPVSTGASPARRENRNGFPGSKYSAPAPCRSGCRGEAPCSLRKERNPGSRNLYTAFITIESAGSTCPYHFPSSSPPLPGIKSVFLACRFC